MKTSRIALVCTAALAATCLAAVALPERRAAATPLPPAAITDLSAAQTTSTSITLTWTAPGSSGNSGTASSYDIRYASALITPTTWSSASSASGAPSPHVAGTTETYTMTVTAGQRYWFAIETSNGTSVSGLSNTVANPPANLNQVDVFTMADDVLNARTRQLVETLHPDMVERASFEFMATQEMARAYTNIPDRLQLAGQGALLGAGVDHDAFAVGGATNYSSGTSVESRASGTTYSDLASSAAPYGFATDEAFNMNYGSTSAIKQLEYKAELQMNAGYNIIEFDQDAMNSSEMATVYTDLHSYAAAHGETVYLTGNGDTLPGADAYDSTPHFTHADFALRQYPRNWEPSGTWSAYGGSSTLAPNYISFYRAMVVRDAGSTPTMPSFGFVDTPASSDGSPTWPANSANWPAFLRINEAQLLASGILPGYTSIYTDAFDTQQNNLFANELNESKFIRENDQLFHNLTLISPSTLTSSAAGVYLSAFSQTGRTIVHAVNGNYSYSANTMTPVSNDTVSVSLTAAPTRIWVTTPDVLSGSRRTVLPTSDWSYSSGTATITLPSLDYHDVIVIEQSSGAAYNPVYSPMQIVMPWNTQSELMAGNHLQLTALQTEGHSTALNWSVNNIAGGSATYGTVDSSGMYTAPLVPPSPATVTITATSPELSSASASVTLTVTASSSTTWSASFAGDPVGSPPPDWEVVQGRGDWKVDTDAGTSVLHEFNMADMNTENDATLFDGQITAGSQSWSEYDYTFQAKLTTTPYLWYGFPSHYQDTFFAAIFGYQDPHDYFEYRLGYDGTARLIRYSGGVRSVIGSAQSVAFPSTGSYESVKVETTGPDARLYVGGTLVRSDPGLVSGVITGSIGLETSQSDVEFKSIAVAPANLALASTVVASASSTNGDPAHSANAARDGSLSTFWVASGVGANWLEYDLGAVTPITSTTQYWQDTDGSTFKYRIDASNDNSTWTTLSDHCSTGIVGTGQAFNDTVSGSWRYVRMYLCSVNNTHWASSQEFQVFSSPQPVDELNDTASAIAYSGGWSYATSLTGYLSTDAHYSNVVGSSATITFTGTGIEWIGALDVPHGTATVKLDGGGGVCGTPTGTCVINTYAAATQFQQALFNAQGLSRGTHTLEIDITTLYSDIDGFAITA